jgi:hypothetical protein
MTIGELHAQVECNANPFLDALNKAAVALYNLSDSFFGFKAYQRAGYPFGKSIRGHKKWRKRKFGG